MTSLADFPLPTTYEEHVAFVRAFHPLAEQIVQRVFEYIPEILDDYPELNHKYGHFSPLLLSEMVIRASFVTLMMSERTEPALGLIKDKLHKCVDEGVRRSLEFPSSKGMSLQ